MADFYGPSADHWHSWLTVEVVDEGDTYATLRFRGGPQAESWGFDITSGITTTLRWTDDGGAHSGSGGLHSATGKSGWSTLADYTDTFEKHHDARTIDASAKTVNASGYKNGTSTASGSIQIGARAHHTWSFDANGGSGAPGSVTKWVGERGYMPTQAPTRGVGWKFAGWSTDKSAASATYSAGGECTDDSDLTFYAVWERTFLPPTVRVTDARRTGADGSADPFGDHGLASFSWSVDQSVDAGNAVASLKLRHRKAGATDWAEESASASGASGTCSKLVAADTGSAYEVQCEVTDSHGLSSTATAVIPVATAPIDVGSYGASVGIGVAAPESPGVAIGSPVSFATRQHPGERSASRPSRTWRGPTCGRTRAGVTSDGRAGTTSCTSSGRYRRPRRPRGVRVPSPRATDRAWATSQWRPGPRATAWRRPGRT